MLFQGLFFQNHETKKHLPKEFTQNTHLPHQSSSRISFPHKTQTKKLPKLCCSRLSDGPLSVFGVVGGSRMTDGMLIDFSFSPVHTHLSTPSPRKTTPLSQKCVCIWLHFQKPHKHSLFCCERGVEVGGGRFGKSRP